MAKNHVAVYGSLRMLRGRCPDCRRMALVLDNKYQCCDKQVSPVSYVKGQKRMIECAQIRKRPSVMAIKKMIELQGDKCLYCDIPFKTAYIHPKKRKLMQTQMCFDHFVPYKYSQDNRDVNFVLACGTCNGIKSDLVFKTVEEAKAHVEYNRAKKGYKKEIYIL